MQDETRSIVRRAYREAVSLVFVGTILVVWVLSVFETGIATPALGGVQQAMVDTIFFVFALAASFLVFGERTIRSAVSLYQDLRGGP